MPSTCRASRPILLVDDDRDIRQAFEMILEAEGYFSVSAANGREALQILIENRLTPAAIFLDLDMPVMNGREFLRAKLAGNYAPESPVVVFAAASQREVLEGTVAWLQKPVDLNELLGVVESVCGQRGT